MRIIEQEFKLLSRRFWLKRLKDEEVGDFSFNGLNFKNTFGVRLSQFWSPALGFDMFAFGIWIQPDNDESIEDKVNRSYGNEAVSIIDRLLASQPLPPQAKTWTDEEYDPLLVETAKFEKCEYMFYIDNGDQISGAGYYHGGLVVHRPHFCFGKPPHPQHERRWNISTSQGLHVLSVDRFVDAKRMASAVAKACDLTKAQTMNLTDAQSRALSRAVKILGRKYIEEN